MKIVGCDFHPCWQQIAIFDAVTGEVAERKLLNGDGEAERFYGALEAPALVGIEACGNSQWFVELLERQGHQVWIGDAAQIRASYVRRQKTDRRDAGHILKLLMEGRFPRLWTPNAAQRDLRKLLIHRHKLVEIRTRVKNGLQHPTSCRMSSRQNDGAPSFCAIGSARAWGGPTKTAPEPGRSGAAHACRLYIFGPPSG